MHEVIGHASGRVSDALKGTPQAALKEQFSALEEGRADLVGLYFLADPKLAALGIVPAADQEAIVRAEYEAFARTALVQLRRIRQGRRSKKTTCANRQNDCPVAHGQHQGDRGAHARRQDVPGGRRSQSVSRGLRPLLAEVQRIKAEGDYAAAKKLFDAYGVHFDPKLRDQVVARVDRLNLPSYTGFVMPKLTPVEMATERFPT